MFHEIQPQYEAEMSLKAQQRWKQAYIAISISNKALKSKKQEASTSVDYDDDDHYSDGFSSIFDKLAGLNDLVKRKDLELLQSFNGVEGLAESLQTNLEHGIRNGRDAERRKFEFGSNTYNYKHQKSFSYFLLKAFKDRYKLLQLGFTAVSLGVRIKQELYKQVWNDGGIVFVTILITALSALADFFQERQFDQLLKRLRNNIKIDVVREGRRQKISMFDVVVGDVVFLNVGDRIPADGLFIDGYSLSVDESSIASMGKSDSIDVNAVENPFLVGGSIVAGGSARMLVISVGMSSETGRDSSDDDHDREGTTLQSLVNKVTSSISMVAFLVASVDLLGILVRYFFGNTKDDQNGVDIPFVIGNVAAIAEGLSLAFTVNRVYSNNGMTDDRAMTQKLSACETIGSTTVICTHKTGILTTNKMEVKTFCVGLDQIEYDSVIVVANDKLLHLFRQGVGLNTTGSVNKSFSGNTYDRYFGSPTEKAVLSWGVNHLGMEMADLKNDYTVLHAEIFSSEKMRSGVLIRKRDDNTIHVHWKGAPEVVLPMCSNCYLKTGLKMALNHDVRIHLEKVIEKMAASGLRCIAFAHKQIPENEDGSKTLNEHGLTSLGIVGIENPCKPGVKEAMETCRSAGVHVMMITGEHPSTAKAIATKCGILDGNDNGMVIDGKEFRKLSKKERMDIVEEIRVMARSSVSDKLLILESLKKKGHVVAVTGHSIDDVPALREADIGISMGIEGTEAARENSDIVILDDDFGSIVKGLRWGRCLFYNIQKFIQFLLPANVAALVINSITDASGRGFPLTAFHMLWVNLIMVILCALTLATEKPSKELMKKSPVIAGDAFRITNIMWRNIAAQSLHQIVVVLTFWFRGRSIFNANERTENTIIFNTFVFCQLFNLFNSRKLGKMNVFEGLHENMAFLGVVGATIGLQIVLLEFVVMIFADTEKLNMKQWGICVAFAALSWPVGWFVELIPIVDVSFLSDIRSMLATTKQGAPETRLDTFGDTHNESVKSESSSLDSTSRGEYVTSRCSRILPQGTYQWSASRKYDDDPNTQINSGSYGNTRAFGHVGASLPSSPQNQDEVRIQINNDDIDIEDK